MAQQFSASIYQINSGPFIPLASVAPISFPSAGVLIRGIATDQTLGSGVRVYSSIQCLATGALFLAMQSQATLVTAANA